MPRNRKSASARFGTFGGVFTPCTLTILGVIMFLRLGEVVGNAGIAHTMLIILFANLITLLTTFSLSAIATNTRVKGGGAYFLISRSLGIEFGGAIGLTFYLSQAIAVALYVVGFTEVLIAIVPSLASIPRWTATMINLAVFLSVYIGAGWTIRMQFGILAILLLSILSFIIGAASLWQGPLLASNWESGYQSGKSFWVMFALFFPAVTGIMAGANMSGDLLNPARSIPRGTFAALFFTCTIYLAFALLLGVSASRSALQTSTMIVADTALLPSLIVAGIFAATLSSALSSLMGAPRILQALARDNVLPVLSFFAKGSGSVGEPRRAIIASFLIAQTCIILGDLNAIAPIITMFFLITYGAINAATFFESISGNPSYRPTFRLCHWSFSLAGALLCGIAMILVNPLGAVMAAIVMTALYRYLLRQELKTTWGDVISGTILERVRRNLLLLEEERYHAKNWRPAILVLGAHAKGHRLRLAMQARQLAGPNGLLILGHVLVGTSNTLLERHMHAENALRKLIEDRDLDAFPAVTIARSLTEGVSSLLQCSGIGAVRPNTVLLGWNHHPDRRPEFEENLRTAARLGRSIIAFRDSVRDEDVAEPSPPNGSLDVWWQGQGANGHLMLLLAYIMRLGPEYKDRPIRILRMIESDEGREDTRTHLMTLSQEVRIPCESVVVVGNDFPAILRKESADASLVFLGMADPRTQELGFSEHLNNLASDCPSVLFVFSAGDMSLHA